MTEIQKPLSFDLLSDLHIDRWPAESALDYSNGKNSDVAIVAGDVSNDPQVTLDELKRIAQVYKTVLFIDGNNEFKRALLAEKNFNLDATEDELRLGIADIPNVHYLNDCTFIRDGVAIIGRNGHWDFKGYEPAVSEEEGRQWLASWLKTDTQTMEVFARQAHRDFEALRDQVIELNKNPNVHTIIVVTHTVPTGKLLNAPPPHLALACNATQGNSEMEKLKDHDSGNKIKYWLFGHQHDFRDVWIDGTRFIAHPRGTPAEELHSTYTSRRIKPSASLPPSTAPMLSLKRPKA